MLYLKKNPRKSVQLYNFLDMDNFFMDKVIYTHIYIKWKYCSKLLLTPETPKFLQLLRIM